jgi:hypothetical protein
MLDTVDAGTNSESESEANNGRSVMRGTIILVVFFLMFTAAYLLIPSPMFPGNVACTLIGGVVSEYTVYVSAFFNGVLYGIVLWLVFIAITRRLTQEK